MNSTKKEIHDIRSWANIRETSIEIAEAIFELANDEVLQRAFAKTKADKLFWGEQTIERKNV